MNGRGRVCDRTGLRECTCSRCVAGALARKHAGGETAEALTPMLPCLCGGRYGFASGPGGRKMLVHSLPYCARYDAVETTEDAVNFSRANRKVA